MTYWLKRLFFLGIVGPIVFLVLGLNIRNRAGLPAGGPAIIVANHNSHLDTLVLMSLFPNRLLPKIRPLAAADYFLRSRGLAFIARQLIGIVPVERGGRGGRDPLQGAAESLEAGDILILFPEGTRGAAEIMTNFRSGIAYLAKRFPDVPVIPVFLHGLGKALPKGEGLWVPFFCDVFVGWPLFWSGDKAGFMAALEDNMRHLAKRHFVRSFLEDEPKDE